MENRGPEVEETWRLAPLLIVQYRGIVEKRKVENLDRQETNSLSLSLLQTNQPSVLTIYLSVSVLPLSLISRNLYVAPSLLQRGSSTRGNNWKETKMAIRRSPHEPRERRRGGLRRKEKGTMAGGEREREREIERKKGRERKGERIRGSD